MKFLPLSLVLICNFAFAKEKIFKYDYETTWNAILKFTSKYEVRLLSKEAGKVVFYIKIPQSKTKQDQENFVATFNLKSSGVNSSALNLTLAYGDKIFLLQKEEEILDMLEMALLKRSLSSTINENSNIQPDPYSNLLTD